MTGLIVALLMAAGFGYLLGSANMAIVVCRLMYKADIRKLGSGNAGMTNVLRNFGKTAATLTLVGDVAKGVISVLVGRGLILLLASDVDTFYGAYIGAIFAILGQMFPLYFRFKGGKGVATAGGTIIALNPLIAAIMLAVFLIIILFSKMVSLGSVLTISLYPVITWLWYTVVGGASPGFPAICTAVIAVIVVWMHRQNIKRILAGKEYKFGQKNQQTSRVKDWKRKRHQSIMK